MSLAGRLANSFVSYKVLRPLELDVAEPAGRNRFPRSSPDHAVKEAAKR